MLQGTGTNKTCDYRDQLKPPSQSQKDLEVQLVLSLILGISAFVVFCILRPRWPSLYAARKRRLDFKVGPPRLPKSFVGWVSRLYRVTEEQVLVSAGLDAFVFLNFLKMAIRIFITMAFFAMIVLEPINAHYRDFNFTRGDNRPHDENSTRRSHLNRHGPDWLPLPNGQAANFGIIKQYANDKSGQRSYLWAYVVFTYFFVYLTLHSINRETFRIIKLRQSYLGSQSTVTDRTFRLTRIPMRLRSQNKLKRLIEKLDVGHVESVTLCRNWKALDSLMAYRNRTLRSLEGVWAKYLKRRAVVTRSHSESTHTRHNGVSGMSSTVDTDDEESGPNTCLLSNGPDPSHIGEGDRPQKTIRHGPLSLRRRKVDAIDYYEEKLRRLDEQVFEARKRQYDATDMALITMDSVASCQMAIQARIDPRPGRLLTKLAPSPSDLVWKNTYSPRGIRRLKSWSITLFITILTLIWIFPTAILASWLSMCTIRHVLPSFADWLSRHSIIYSIFQNGIPTAVVSGLNVAVPYLYDWLSNHQGMMSQGDVELSVISKNFFFTFFNTFFVFAISRTGFDFWSDLQKLLKDTSQIPAVIAADVEDLSIFYINFIMLQGVGLMPFRILQTGSVFMYPIYRFMSSTPRDLAELKKPPVFQYGFYLPTALLVFNLCLIYSVLVWGFAILLFGAIYFILGYFTFKYMMLYSMDQPQHATGGAWRIICYRIVIGLVVFEVVMIGQILSLSAFVQSVAVVPLLPLTVWYSYYFNRRFEPLTRCIALRAIKQPGNETDGEEVADDSLDEEEPQQSSNTMRRGSTLDEFREKGLMFANPSLVVPLGQPWIYKDPPPPVWPEEAEEGRRERLESDREQATLILPQADRSLGIGDDNVWANEMGDEEN